MAVAGGSAGSSGGSAGSSGGSAGTGGTVGGNGGTAGSHAGTAGTTAGTAGSDNGAAGDAGAPPFEHPDPPLDYVPQEGTCGFDKPAFCDTFESGPKDGGRSGELDPATWSVVRGMPYNTASLDDAFRIGPALIGACRADLKDTTVLPDSDVLVWACTAARWTAASANGTAPSSRSPRTTTAA